MSDLINISYLERLDTFETWFATTNEIIDYLNRVNVYDINASQGISDVRSNGQSILRVKLRPFVYDNSNVSGFLTVNESKKTGGLGFDSDGNLKIDFRYLPDVSDDPASAVSQNDYYMFEDISELSDSPNRVKKIKAKHILPDRIVGDLTIEGDLTVEGTRTEIASQNLFVYDKLIELNVGQFNRLLLDQDGTTGINGSGTLLATGVTGLTAYSFVRGTTVAQYRTDLSAWNGEYQAVVWEFNYDSSSLTGGGTTLSALFYYGMTGPSATVTTFATGATVYRKTGVGTETGPAGKFWVYTSLQNEETEPFSTLDDGAGGGIRLITVDGNKDIIFELDAYDGETFDAWVFNENLKIDSGKGLILDSFYSDNDTFSFRGDGVGGDAFSTRSVDLRLYDSGVSGTENEYWFISRTPYNTANANRFRIGLGSTDGGTSAIDILPNLSLVMGTTALAVNLNADYLDGAGATTIPPSVSGLTSQSFIPLTYTTGGEKGYIDPRWIQSIDSIGETVNYVSHGFSSGDVIKRTGSTGYAKALANNVENAEAIGIVENVIDIDNFHVIYKGKINLSPSGATYSPGEVYFLSYITNGLLVKEQQSVSGETGEGKFVENTIRKPMMIATNLYEGIVQNYIGQKIFNLTDMAYVESIVPVGTIYAYAGPTSSTPPGWLLCDGKIYHAENDTSEYALLKSIAQSRFYTLNTISSINNVTGKVVVNFPAGLRNFADITNATFRLQHSTQNIESLTIDSIDTVNKRLTLAFDANSTQITYSAGATVQVFGSGNWFFVPDLRGRNIRGSGSGEYINYLGNMEVIPEVDLADIGGKLDFKTINVDTGVVNSALSGDANNNIEPYFAVNYLIRASKLTPISIVTGHDHDSYYVKYNTASQTGLAPGNDTAPGSAGSTGRSNARTNIQALSRETNDTMAGILKISPSSTFTSVALGVTGSISLTNELICGGTAYFGNNASVTGIFSVGDLLTVNDNANKLYVNTSLVGITGDVYLYGSSSDLFIDGRSFHYGNFFVGTNSNPVNATIYADTRNEGDFVQVEGDVLLGDGNASNGITFSSGKVVIKASDASSNTQIRVSGGEIVVNENEVAANPQPKSFTIKNTNLVVDGGQNVVAAPKVGLGSVWGLNSTTNANLGAVALPYAYVYSTYVQNPARNQSRLQTAHYGDMTIFGDGITSGVSVGSTYAVPQNQYVFSFDPLTSQMRIRGRFAVWDSAGATITLADDPSLSFVTNSNLSAQSTADSTYFGSVRGLTYPTSNHYATNKEYVDEYAAVRNKVQLSSSSTTTSSTETILGFTPECLEIYNSEFETPNTNGGQIIGITRVYLGDISVGSSKYVTGAVSTISGTTTNTGVYTPSNIAPVTYVVTKLTNGFTISIYSSYPTIVSTQMSSKYIEVAAYKRWKR